MGENARLIGNWLLDIEDETYGSISVKVSFNVDGAYTYETNYNGLITYTDGEYFVNSDGDIFVLSSSNSQILVEKMSFVLIDDNTLEINLISFMDGNMIEGFIKISKEIVKMEAKI